MYFHPVELSPPPPSFVLLLGPIPNVFDSFFAFGVITVVLVVAPVSIVSGERASRRGEAGAGGGDEKPRWLVVLAHKK